MEAKELRNQVVNKLWSYGKLPKNIQTLMTDNEVDFMLEVINTYVAEQLAIDGVVKRTLDRKIAAYELVNMWFAKEYNTGTDKDEVESMEKEAAELNAQIKVLRFVLSEVHEH